MHKNYEINFYESFWFNGLSFPGQSLFARSRLATGRNQVVGTNHVSQIVFTLQLSLFGKKKQRGSIYQVP